MNIVTHVETDDAQLVLITVTDDGTVAVPIFTNKDEHWAALKQDDQMPPFWAVEFSSAQARQFGYGLIHAANHADQPRLKLVETEP